MRGLIERWVGLFVKAAVLLFVYIVVVALWARPEFGSHPGRECKPWLYNQPGFFDGCAPFYVTTIALLCAWTALLIRKDKAALCIGVAPAFLMLMHFTVFGAVSLIRGGV